MKITDFPTFITEWDKRETQEMTAELLKETGDLQYKMFAQGRFSVLIVLQGIDASGKDGLIKDLLQYCNPIGIKIHSFKKPTEIEMAHDFLWRVHKATPAKGEMQFFIRSHYEDILVPSVEKYIPTDIIEQRYGIINNFEQNLEQNNTKVLKFFLNVSQEEQKRRLIERIEIREKQWKHKDGDWDTREKFGEYMEVYQKILNSCNLIPWYVVPSDKNWQKLYYVAEIVHKTLKNLDLQWPGIVTEKFRNGA